MSSDWSELPNDLLGLITDKLRSFSLTEYIRFGSIYFEWRSFSIQNYEYINLPSKLPLLLIPIPSTSTDDHQQPQPPSTTGKNDKVVDYFNPKQIWLGQDSKQRYKSTRTFYSLYENKVYHDFPLSIPYYKNIRGSSHGWLVTVEECYCNSNNGTKANYPVRLLNPFRTAGENNEIQLPPLTTGNVESWHTPYHSYYLQKVCLSENPSSLSLSDLTTELVVLGFYSGYRLAYCRPGDRSWTHLELDPRDRPIMDITFYKGQFYAVLQNGYVFSFVFDSTELIPNLIVKEEISPPKENENIVDVNRYIVEYDGDLLQVRRDVSWPNGKDIRYETTGFRVFKLDESTNEWVERKNLDGRMFFLGTNGSISLPAADFPGCKPNSIFFTDDNERFNSNPWMGPHDIGVFNLEDGSFEQHYTPKSKTIMPPPFWIQPML